MSKQGDLNKNLKINFYVMREIWQIVNGRGGTTIYDMLNMSRTRFTRALDGISLRISNQEMRALVGKTGLKDTIFNGKEVFVVYDIKDTAWTSFLEFRTRLDRLSAQEQKAYEQKKADIHDSIKVEIEKGTNPLILGFSQQIKLNGEGASVELNSIMTAFSKIGLKMLEAVEEEMLDKYAEQIEKQIKMIQAVKIYKQYK